MIGPVAAGKVGLLLGAYRAYHGHACTLGELHQGRADASSGADNQYGFGRAVMAAFLQQRKRHLVVGKAYGGLQIDAVGKQMHRIGRRHDIFGIAAATLGKIAGAEQHLASDPDAFHAGPDGGNAAGDVVAGIHGQRGHPFVDATAEEHVGLANAESLCTDLHLAGTGRGNW